MDDVDGTVTLASDSVKDLAKYSPLFDRLSLIDGGVQLSGSTAVLGYDIGYLAQGSVDGPERRQGHHDHAEDGAHHQLGARPQGGQHPGRHGHAGAGLHRQVPAARRCRVRSLDVSASSAEVRITADQLPLSEQGLQTTGTC